MLRSFWRGLILRQSYTGYSAPVFWNRDTLRRYFIEIYAPDIGAAEAAKQFEEYPHDLVSEKLRAGLAQTRQDTGIICLTAVPNSIRMWSYYAQAHERICVGFDAKAGPFFAAMKVIYQNPDAPVDIATILLNDPSELAAHISLRKAAEWEFEQEYRVPIYLRHGERLKLSIIIRESAAKRQLARYYLVNCWPPAKGCGFDPRRAQFGKT